MNFEAMLEQWKKELPEFEEKTGKFLTGEFAKGDYKGYSGRYGSYAQKDGKHFMLRLRTPAGRVTKPMLQYVAEAMEAQKVTMAHYTTCQTMQLHNLTAEQLHPIMKGCLEHGIITIGGGGDYPRNVMCSPLSGLEKEEYFDVMPYAQAAGLYMLSFINEAKMPRKLKVCFSDSEKNLPHATFRDLGFQAEADGTFTVYSAGGLGNNPRLGVKMAEKVDPSEILYYIKAMWVTFRTYGNYENRGKARTRYMQEALGGAENYRNAYLEKLAEVKAEGEDLAAVLKELLAKVPAVPERTPDGSVIEHKRAVPQKTEGLYAVEYHPIGGQPKMESMEVIRKLVMENEGIELRIAPDESVYVINLTGNEAKALIEATPDSAASVFETSVSCIGASICQVGVRDSQELLNEMVNAVRAAEIPDGALPKVRVSGCPSSCSAHQAAIISFRGHVKKVDGAMVPAFLLSVDGCEKRGSESLGTEVGTIATSRIPEFMVKLGKEVAASGLSYEEWRKSNPGALEALAADYTA